MGNNYLEFFKIVGKLKRVNRAGWIREKVKEPESVAEHSFRTIVISLILGKRLGIDRDKLVRMAIIHDLGEIYAGDIVWRRGYKEDLKLKEEKEKKELEGLSKIFSLIEGSEEFTELFEELISSSSQEAKLFWEIDKLEAAFQAFEYEKEQKVDLYEFITDAKLRIKNKYLNQILKQIIKERKINL